MGKFTLGMLLLGCFSSHASELSEPLFGIVVTEHNERFLKLRNHSSDSLHLDIYGQDIKLAPKSGSLIDCQAFAELEINFVESETVFFSVPCSSLVVFNEGFELDVY